MANYDHPHHPLYINDLHGRLSQRSRIAAIIRRTRQEVEPKSGYGVFIDAGVRIGENTGGRKMRHQGYNRP
jgi:hypothetical protein